MSAPLDLSVAREAARRRQRLIRHVRTVHRLGERAVFELVDEIARTVDCADIVEQIAEQIAGIDVDLLRVLGGDHFPHRPIYAVRS